MHSNGFLNRYGWNYWNRHKDNTRLFSVTSIEIEIENDVYSNSMVSSIALDILNIWFHHDLQWVTFNAFIGCLKALYHFLQDGSQ